MKNFLALAMVVVSTLLSGCATFNSSSGGIRISSDYAITEPVCARKENRSARVDCQGEVNRANDEIVQKMDKLGDDQGARAYNRALQNPQYDRSEKRVVVTLDCRTFRTREERIGCENGIADGRRNAYNFMRNTVIPQNEEKNKAAGRGAAYGVIR